MVFNAKHFINAMTGELELIYGILHMIIKLKNKKNSGAKTLFVILKPILKR